MDDAAMAAVCGELRGGAMPMLKTLYLARNQIATTACATSPMRSSAAPRPSS